MAISVEIRKEICLALNSTALHLQRQAVEFAQDPEYADLEDMYLGDALDYEIILELFINGETQEALSRYWLMDTAARDMIECFIPISAHRVFFQC